MDPPRAAPELGAASRWFDAIRATPGRAAIFRAATPGRFFAEPETGGEAYIPLALSKRKRSVAIWMETGRLLGMLNEGGVMLSARSFQNGGILDPLPRTPSVREGVIIQAPIQIDITTQPGQDNAAIASEVRTVVRRELTRAGRDLLDIR